LDVVQVQKYNRRVPGGHLKTRNRAGISATVQNPEATNDGRAKQNPDTDPESITPDASSRGRFGRLIAHRLSICFTQAPINGGAQPALASL
jgi:hypothetical protein